MSANRSCYGHEIANPRIKYGVAMTKWVRMRWEQAWRCNIGMCLRYSQSQGAALFAAITDDLNVGS